MFVYTVLLVAIRHFIPAQKRIKIHRVGHEFRPHRSTVAPCPAGAVSCSGDRTAHAGSALERNVTAAGVRTHFKAERGEGGCRGSTPIQQVRGASDELRLCPPPGSPPGALRSGTELRAAPGERIIGHCSVSGLRTLP